MTNSYEPVQARQFIVLSVVRVKHNRHNLKQEVNKRSNTDLRKQ